MYSYVLHVRTELISSIDIPRARRQLADGGGAAGQLPSAEAGRGLSGGEPADIDLPWASVRLSSDIVCGMLPYFVM